MTEEDEAYRCRACDYRGTHEELAEHADEAGHPKCIVCAHILGEFDRQTCDRCTQRVREDLNAIVGNLAELERRIREGAYSGGWLTPLAMVSDGSLSTLKPWRKVVDALTVEVEHMLVGEHPAYVERRVPPNGREHFEDHWPSDPVSVLALLEVNERDWRHEFGHGPAEEIATVENCASYLRTWLSLAAKTHPGFDEFASEMYRLRVAVEHVAALALDPKDDVIPCACGGELQQHFGDKGLSDNRVCRRCGTVYKPSEYVWRYRMLTELPGWVPVDKAAAKVDRPSRTVWAWVSSLDVPSVCQRLTKRVVVDLAAVEEKSDQTPRQQRKRSA